MPDFIKKSLFQKIRNLIDSKNLLWIIILSGIALYLRQYLFNRSLWIDEAALSLNIIKLNVISFLDQPLHYWIQAAPFGFLAIEKMGTCLLGKNEYILRLFPLICGILSLWLFSLMAKIYLHRGFVAVALFGFVINPVLIYYSSEVKPYCSDVLFTLLSYVLISQTCLEQLSWPKVGMISLLGMIMIWSSFPIAFILSGIAGTLFVSTLIQKNWSQSWKISVVIFFWLINFTFYYAISLHSIIHGKGVEDYWQDGYISFMNMNTWSDVLTDVLRYPMGFGSCSWLAGLLILVGGYSFFQEDKKKFFLLSTPLFFVFLASGLHQYACKDRLALFLVPIFLVMLINGVRTISLQTQKYKIITTLLLIGVLFHSSFFSTWKNLIEPKGREEIRSVILYVKKNIQQGDIIYLYFGAAPAFDYYRSLFGFFPDNYTIKEDWAENNPSKLRDDLKKLHNLKRVWLLFSHFEIQKNGTGDPQYLCDYLLKSRGILLDKFCSNNGTNACGYLFDLSKFPETADAMTSFNTREYLHIEK